MYYMCLYIVRLDLPLSV